MSLWQRTATLSSVSQKRGEGRKRGAGRIEGVLKEGAGQIEGVLKERGLLE